MSLLVILYFNSEKMLRSRLKKVISLRNSGYQSKWNMLKYRTNVDEYPYHQEQFHIDEDIDFSYLLPKDHPEYKPPGRRFSRF